MSDSYVILRSCLNRRGYMSLGETGRGDSSYCLDIRL